MDNQPDSKPNTQPNRKIAFASLIIIISTLMSFLIKFFIDHRDIIRNINTFIVFTHICHYLLTC